MRRASGALACNRVFQKSRLGIGSPQLIAQSSPHDSASKGNRNVYKFLRASNPGDVNCLVKGEFTSLKTSEGETLDSLFAAGWDIAAMTELDTGFVLIALRKP